VTKFLYHICENIILTHSYRGWRWW